MSSWSEPEFQVSLTLPRCIRLGSDHQPEIRIVQVRVRGAKDYPVQNIEELHFKFDLQMLANREVLSQRDILIQLIGIANTRENPRLIADRKLARVAESRGIKDRQPLYTLLYENCSGTPGTKFGRLPAPFPRGLPATPTV